METLKVAVLASGTGSNFKAIIDSVESGRLRIKIQLLLTNNPEAGALDIAKEANIPGVVVSRNEFENREAFLKTILSVLDQHDANFIILAGYMKRIPPEVIRKYSNRIVNIHPALLPSFGGKGMFGRHVHEAVLEYGCKVTGVTVHMVDEVYDHGPIVAQRTVPVENGDTPASLAARVLEMEHRLYPEVLQLFAEDKVHIDERKVAIH